MATQNAERLKALADPLRLRIMAILHDRGETCVCELLAELGTTQSNVSTHLRVLRHVGLVNSEKLGKWVFYSLNKGVVADLLEWLGGNLDPSTAASKRPDNALYAACCGGRIPTSRAEAEEALAGGCSSAEESSRDEC